MDQDDGDGHRGAARRGQWVLAGFMLVAAFFLWTEHRAHVLGILPYLFVLACPLMHLFHHHGHGHRHHRPGAAPPADTPGQPGSGDGGRP
ncbi:MAG TPA: DUF2933 domain-containing protein [Burkholderiaceae bacterium]|nr:DUF2933 domain-containing protein [Burkholderiaceae bacterium]